MLDVHPAHHAATTWRDFFIHIATIVIGLLIAVGLEQTVEYVHHRREVAESRRALAVERRINAHRFAVQTREFHRFVPQLKTNLAILMYLKEHPHAPAAAWPGHFDWLFYSSPYSDTAWTSAVQAGVVERLPRQERAEDAELAFRFEGLTQNMQARRSAIRDAQASWIQCPEPARMTPQQIDAAIAGVTSALKAWYESAALQRAFAPRFADFKDVPASQEFESILHVSDDLESRRAFEAIRQETIQFEREQNAGSQESAGP